MNKIKLKKFIHFSESILPNEAKYLLKIQQLKDAEKKEILGLLLENSLVENQPKPFSTLIDKRKYSYIKNWAEKRLARIDVDVTLEWLIDLKKKIDNYNIAVKTGFDPNIKITQEMTKGASIYIGPFFKLDNFVVKYIVALSNTGRFFFSGLGLNNFYPFYEDNFHTSQNIMTYFYALSGMILIIFLFKYLTPECPVQ